MARVTKKPEERKQELIDVSLKLFLKKGYDNVSVRDILAEVDGAPGMFYYYFKSKDEIYQIAIEQYVAQQIAIREKILFDRKKSIVTRYCELEKVTKEAILLFFKSKSKLNETIILEQNDAIFLAMIDGLCPAFTGFIAEAVKEGIFGPQTILNNDNIEEVVIFLIHGIFGVIHSDVTLEKGLTLKKAESMIRSLLIQVLDITPEYQKQLFK